MFHLDYAHEVKLILFMDELQKLAVQANKDGQIIFGS